MTLETNHATLSGKILSNPEVDHEMYSEKILSLLLGIERNSGTMDEIVIQVSDRLIFDQALKEGDFITVNGRYSSYNKDGHTFHYLLAETLTIDDELRNINDLRLIGFICKPPTFRLTPLGREIADVLLAVDRPYGKSDYINCILWGRNAKYISQMPVGTKLQFFGRIQSRRYNKKISDTEIIEKTAYEVSVSRVIELSA